MDFIVQWLWYLVAFVAGSAVAWLIAVSAIHRTSRDDALATLSGPRQTGAR